MFKLKINTKVTVKAFIIKFQINAALLKFLFIKES